METGTGCRRESGHAKHERGEKRDTRGGNRETRCARERRRGGSRERREARLTCVTVETAAVYAASRSTTCARASDERSSMPTATFSTKGRNVATSSIEADGASITTAILRMPARSRLRRRRLILSECFSSSCGRRRGSNDTIGPCPTAMTPLGECARRTTSHDWVGLPSACSCSTPASSVCSPVSRIVASCCNGDASVSQALLKAFTDDKLPGSTFVSARRPDINHGCFMLARYARVAAAAATSPLW